MTAPIGLFYGSTTCYTEMIAERIQELAGKDRIDINNISQTPVNKIVLYEYIIFGIPTWDYGELQEDWDIIWDELDELDLRGKTVAIFGLGDQIGYGQWFQDAIGYLAIQVESCGAELVGHWPNIGYEFEASKGLTPDSSHFFGLALDEENQADQSEDRLKKWLSQLQMPGLGQELRKD